MKWVALVAALGGCNQIFGLGGTNARPAVDAQFFDAPADAPFACPSAVTLPQFSPLFVQVLPQGECVDYTLSRGADLAIMQCTVSLESVGTVIEQGKVDDSALTMLPSSLGLQQPVLTPEGDELWDLGSDGTNYTVRVYTRAGMTWQYAYDAYTTTTPLGMIGTPSAKGAPRHVLVSATKTLVELVETAPHTLGMPTTYSLIAWDMTIGSPPHISPDGRRLVFQAQLNDVTHATGVFYAARDAPDAGFPVPQLLVGPPVEAQSPFLTDDCSRMYFSGLGSVLYVPVL